MSTKDDGGPAFPSHGTMGEIVEYGMSLRQWYAGLSLAGELAAQSQETGEWAASHFEVLANRCFAIADAMIAESKK